jgi:hypothetical protein
MMLATALPLRSGKYAAILPPCPNCGRPMYLARATPRSGGLPDLCVFKCGECSVLVTESADERRHV